MTDNKPTLNALDALDRLYNLELAYEERRALYEAVRTALKQSSAEVVTVEEFTDVLQRATARKSHGGTGVMVTVVTYNKDEAEEIAKVIAMYHNGIIIRSEK